MSYRIAFGSSIRDRIAGWGLPDSIFVDIYLHLRLLEEQPARQLRRLEEPYPGMFLRFSVIDPADRFTEYSFTFGVDYGQDEETLHVTYGTYQRTKV